jgi:DeoR/GlpR family transcriptional regulator of sugar metabolism
MNSIGTNSEFHPRLEWILNEIRKRRTLTRQDLLQRFTIKKSTAANDFNALIEKGIIARFGSGRGIYYRLSTREQL